MFSIFLFTIVALNILLCNAQNTNTMDKYQGRLRDKLTGEILGCAVQLRAQWGIGTADTVRHLHLIPLYIKNNVEFVAADGKCYKISLYYIPLTYNPRTLCANIFLFKTTAVMGASTLPNLEFDTDRPQILDKYNSTLDEKEKPHDGHCNNMACPRALSCEATDLNIKSYPTRNMTVIHESCCPCAVLSMCKKVKKCFSLYNNGLDNCCHNEFEQFGHCHTCRNRCANALFRYKNGNDLRLTGLRAATESDCGCPETKYLDLTCTYWQGILIAKMNGLAVADEPPTTTN